MTLVLLAYMAACTSNTKSALDMDNYFAWCIVPFDNQNRTPAQRMEMLKSLGFKSYAYDWRQKHLAEMREEFDLARQNNIHVNAVWMWIDVADSVGHLSADNEKILEILKDTGLKTQLWMGISEAYFEGLSEDESMTKAVAMVSYLSERADSLGCKVGLYNHGGWFGDPVNQVKIIKAMPDKKIGIIFNFHHAHELLDQFPELVDVMMPYLWVVNLNGMKAEGPKILPIGSGDREGWMIDVLKEKGFTGPFGILGHVDDADVKVILEQNLKGLRSLQ
jgi:hypothetical protein